MTLSIPQACSSCPSSNPAGPAPMIATFVRNTCSLGCYRLQAKAAVVAAELAMIIILYNNICTGPLKDCAGRETMSMRKTLLALALALSVTPAFAQEKTFEL